MRYEPLQAISSTATRESFAYLCLEHEIWRHIDDHKILLVMDVLFHLL